MSETLRVLHVLGELKPSGAETMLVAAAPLFRDEGLELEVLSTGVVPGPYATRFEQVGYRVHHIPFRRSPGFFLAVRRLMQAGSYDVIHLHVEGANFWFGLAACSVKAPIVLRTVHSNFAFAGNLRWRRGVQRRMLAKLGVRHVSISPSVRDTESRCYKLKTTLIWNWYDSLRFTQTKESARLAARAAFGIAESDFVIASVGNCSPVKNHTAILEALAMLPVAERPVYLHAGIEQTGEPERECARRLGLEDRVRFLGGTSDVLPLLQAADGYVMPSLYEGFSIAALEALGTGLPAILSDVSGLKDFRKIFPGLLYTGTTAADIAVGLQALNRLTPSERASIQTNYPAIAQDSFGIYRGVKEYIALYKGLEPASAMSDPQTVERATNA